MQNSAAAHLLVPHRKLISNSPRARSRASARALAQRAKSLSLSLLNSHSLPPNLPARALWYYYSTLSDSCMRTPWMPAAPPARLYRYASLVIHICIYPLYGVPAETRNSYPPVSRPRERRARSISVATLRRMRARARLGPDNAQPMNKLYAAGEAAELRFSCLVVVACALVELCLCVCV